MTGLSGKTLRSPDLNPLVKNAHIFAVKHGVSDFETRFGLDRVDINRPANAVRLHTTLERLYGAGWITIAWNEALQHFEMSTAPWPDVGRFHLFKDLPGCQAVPELRDEIPPGFAWRSVPEPNRKAGVDLNARVCFQDLDEWPLRPPNNLVCGASKRVVAFMATIHLSRACKGIHGAAAITKSRALLQTAHRCHSPDTGSVETRNRSMCEQWLAAVQKI